MELGLTDKVAIVTGGSEGIGKAAAQRMAEEGARVVIVARGQEKLDEAALDIRTATEGMVLPLSADVSHPDSAERVVQTALDNFGRVSRQQRRGLPGQALRGCHRRRMGV